MVWDLPATAGAPCWATAAGPMQPSRAPGPSGELGAGVSTPRCFLGANLVAWK